VEEEEEEEGNTIWCVYRYDIVSKHMIK
jgi:hypothetical protein